MKINVSIVLYNHRPDEISALVSVLNDSPSVKGVYLVDNSPESNKALADLGCKYIFTGKNIGYGSGHNVAIRKSIEENQSYHLVLNPDIELNPAILAELVAVMDKQEEIGMIMPKILSPDGSVQYLPKLLPSPFSILKRKLAITPSLSKKLLNNYELRFVDKDGQYNVPILSGCFSLFRLSALKEIGLYDEHFFMYFEDFDISRRMHEKYETIYYTNVSIIHSYESGANKNKKLFFAFLNSARQYFNKWGWFFDKNRKKINESVLKLYKTKG